MDWRLNHLVCERWPVTHTWGMVVYILVVKRSTFFPLSQLMIHGVIVASHGDALHWGLNKFDVVDFTQEVWSFVVPGTWNWLTDWNFLGFDPFFYEFLPKEVGNSFGRFQIRLSFKTCFLCVRFSTFPTFFLGTEIDSWTIIPSVINSMTEWQQNEISSKILFKMSKCNYELWTTSYYWIILWVRGSPPKMHVTTRMITLVSRAIPT